MTDVTTLPPTIRSHDQGERRWFYGGGIHTWKATEEETAGAFLLFETALDRGKVTPLHTHPAADETLYVLEGEILLHMAGEEHRLTGGDLAVAPRGVPHAFLVLSQAARLLCLHTPGCCQAFYWDASEPLTDSDASRTVDFTRVQASAERNGGIEILGPPPFDAT